MAGRLSQEHIKARINCIKEIKINDLIIAGIILTGIVITLVLIIV